MQKSESIKELASALIQVQKKLPKVEKTKTNPFFSSKYVPLEEVMPKALEVLNKNGLTLIQTVGYNLNGSTLTTMLVHTSGEWISDEQPLLLAKNDPQGQGSAITYARRYALMSAVGIVADQDDDGTKASKASLKKTVTVSAPTTKPAAYKSENELVKKVEDPEMAFDYIQGKINSATTIQEVNAIMQDATFKGMPFEMKKELQSNIGFRIGQLSGKNKTNEVAE